MATRVSIRKGDEVMVISGKDRGRTGRVVNVLPKKNRVMVEGIARAKRHARPSKRNQQGGIMDIELFIDLSNVQVMCKHCSRPTRVGHRLEEGVNARICKRCEGEL